MPFVALLITLRRVPDVSPQTGIPSLAALFGADEIAEPAKMPARAEQRPTMDNERGLLTLAILRRSAGDMSVRVTALEEEGRPSLSEVLQRCAAHPVIALEGRCWRIEVVDLARPPWTGVSTWEEFLEEPTRRRINARLATPLVVPMQGASVGRHMTAHFPHPAALFPDLARRWSALGGPPLPTDAALLWEEQGPV